MLNGDTIYLQTVNMHRSNIVQNKNPSTITHYTVQSMHCPWAG